VKTWPLSLRFAPHALLLLGLLGAVSARRGEAGCGESYAAFGADGLGWQGGEAGGAGALEGATNGDGATVEVEVFPAQAEKFAFA
jgi:hypothetical protein